jgi:hypothetical protein
MSTLFTATTTFLPQVDGLQERTLALGEGPVRRRDEEHEVRARDELASERLVLADHGVRPRRVHDRDLPEDVGGQGDHLGARARRGPTRGVSVPQLGDPRRGRGGALLQHAVADERVDHCALAGVELADDYEEEHLVELGY